EEFVETPSEESLLTFLVELGYKGQVNKLPSMFVDYMHQPWRTLATIINKCLSGKTSSNDKLRKSRIEILWDYEISKHFLSQHKSLAKLKYLYINTIKDDGVLSRLKFVRTGEDFQEYGQAILDTMLTEEIKQSENYQTFLSLSTGLIPPKKTRGKGSQGKKVVVTSKKKSLISVDDNIIPEPDVALELGKSISTTEVKEQEEARRVHETHERLVTEKPASEEDSNEPANRPTGRRRTSGIVFRDTLRVSKKKSLDHSQKLKGIQVLTEEEQLAADTIQAIKGSNMVPDGSIVIFTTSSEGTGITLGVPDEVKGSSKAKVDSAIDWGSENKSDYSDEAQVDEEEIKWVSTDEEEEKQNDQDNDNDDDRSLDIKETDDDEKIDDEFVHGDEYVHDDMDKEIKDAEDNETGKDDEEITDAKKIEATKGEYEQAGKLLPISSSLHVSFGFGNQFLNLSSDIFLIVSVILEQTTPTPSLTLPTETPVSTVHPPPPIVSAISSVQQQTTTIPTPPITIIAPSVTTTVLDPLPAIVQRVSELEKDVNELKQVDHSSTILATIRSQVPSAINEYLGSSIRDALQKVLQKHTEELIQKSSQKDVYEIIKIKQ
ncbi:hypothetical protein Tco_1037646, partial [Tanacetum coccineum]